MRIIFILLISLILIAEKTIEPHTDRRALESAALYFREQCASLAVTCNNLSQSIREINCLHNYSLTDAKLHLAAARRQYKKIECFLEFFFPAQAHLFNAPPTFEMEEPFLEYQQPAGFQVIESLLFGKINPKVLLALREQSTLLYESSRGLPSLLFAFKGNDGQLLQSFRMELDRLICLGISGYDAPDLKTGIVESEMALESISQQIRPLLSSPSPVSDSVRYFLKASILYLHCHTDFNPFDRLFFLRTYAMPLERALARICKENNVCHSQKGMYNPDAETLFDRNAFATNHVKGLPSDSALISLGRSLFNDKTLSANSVKSCASCHNPEKKFSDGLPKSIGLDGHSPLSRNAPSLNYSGFQLQFFWDGRAHSLEEQILNVLHNEKEMGADSEKIKLKMIDDPLYVKYFKWAFPDSNRRNLSDLTLIAKTIAMYIRSLGKMNAGFDRFMNGDDQALSRNQKQGFNLFMGKARCGTCHFIPLFNGLIPPEFNQTAFEVIGTTVTDNLNKPLLDSDQGRYHVFPLDFNKRAFKTPSLRNITETAPYMHNGAFKSLDRVVEFYDRGGGVGLGLAVADQTLSSKPLHLTKTEKKNIVLFMESLTDAE